MHKFSECLTQLGVATSLLGEDAFFAALCESFTKIESVGHVLVLYYPSGEKPQCLYSNCKTDEAYTLEVDAYINGPFIFDPYYQTSMSGAANGAYRLKDIAPDNFKKTEYFRHYYKATNITDELSYLANIDNGEHLHLSVSPFHHKKNFTPNTLQFLRDLSTMVVALISQHWQLSQNAAKAAGNSPQTLNQTLQQALKNFGSMLLTPREHDVLQLILHGHSNKAAAERLDISLATVKLHRKRIYQKLDISSQSELFYLFIDALSSAQNDHCADPLQAYMNLS